MHHYYKLPISVSINRHSDNQLIHIEVNVHMILYVFYSYQIPRVTLKTLFYPNNWNPLNIRHVHMFIMSLKSIHHAHKTGLFLQSR